MCCYVMRAVYCILLVRRSFYIVYMMHMVCMTSVCAVLRLFVWLMEDVNRRLELCKFWETLIVQGFDPADTYSDMMCVLRHDNDIPEISIADQVCSMAHVHVHLQTYMRKLYIKNLLRIVYECIFISQKEDADDDVSVDDVADVTLVLSPRMDTHELGAYAAQLLIMFDCHEVALQVARDAFERLSQVRIWRHQLQYWPCTCTTY